MHECHNSHVEIHYTWSHCPLCEAMKNQEFIIRYKDLLEEENKGMREEFNRLQGFLLNDMDRSKFLEDKKLKKVKEVLGVVRDAVYR